MDLAKALEIIGKYKYLLIAAVLISMGAAIVATYLISEKYTATALLQVRPEEVASVKDTNMAIFLGAKDPYATIVQVDIEILKSRPIASYVVKKLSLDKSEKRVSSFKRFKAWVKARLFDLWTILKYGYLKKQDPFEKAVSSVQRAIKAVPVRSTYLINLSATASEPGLAARIANTAAEAFINYHRQTVRNEVLTLKRILEEELAERKKRLDEAEERLEKYKKQEKIAALPEEITNRIQAVVQLQVTKAVGSSTKRKASIDRTVSRLLKELEEMTAKERKLESLRRDVKTVENEYLTLLREYETARIAESRAVSGIRIVDKATPPLYPSRPIKVLYAGVAAIAGLVIALGFAFLQEAVRGAGQESVEQEVA
jgi:uncharacterized protein involved in exopolysaccharide biosynthesis